MNIVLYGNPILRQDCEDIDISDDGLEKLSKDMVKTMYKGDGIGLAGPQVGLKKNIFVVESGKGPLTIVNPDIIYRSKNKKKRTEGCLSLPGVRVKVKRSTEIEVKGYLVEQKKYVKIKAQGLLARSIQHEFDHLQGTLIIDYLSFWKKKKVIRKLKKRVRE